MNRALHSTPPYEGSADSAAATSGTERGASPQDTPVLLRLPDLGGSLKTKANLGPANVVGAPDTEPTPTEPAQTESSAAEPDSQPTPAATRSQPSKKFNWKDEKTGKLNKTLVGAFVVGLLIMFVVIYNSSPKDPPAEPDFDQWVNSPEVDLGVVEQGVPSLGGAETLAATNDDLTTNPNLSISTSPQGAMGSPLADTNAPPLPDVTPEQSVPAESIAVSESQTPSASYPVTDPANFRYPEQLPFMKNGQAAQTGFNNSSPTAPGMATLPGGIGTTPRR